MEEIMKEKYEEVKMEVIEFEAEDILTESNELGERD